MTILCQNAGRCSRRYCLSNCHAKPRFARRSEQWRHQRQLGPLRANAFMGTCALFRNCCCKRVLTRVLRSVVPIWGPLCCRLRLQPKGDCDRLGLQRQRWLGDHPCLVGIWRQALPVEQTIDGQRRNAASSLRARKECCGLALKREVKRYARFVVSETKANGIVATFALIVDGTKHGIVAETNVTHLVHNLLWRS